MTPMFVRHAVEDFGRWKNVYDDLDDTRKDRGVKGDAVFQETNDPNDVTAWHDFDDLEAARSLSASEELREAMDEAGVVGDPTIWFTQPV